MPNVMPLQADDPRRVGRYRLTGRLAGRDAAGGSAQRVFMARMVNGGTVVLTLLGNQRAAGPAARDRFTAEARVARRVAPFCAARILDAGIEGDDPYLVTEYVPGLTVAEAVGHDGPLPDLTVEALAIGTATGLTAIHQAGLVHGEFGPDQVVLGPDGPRVTHFGITPPYGAATPAADLLAWAQTVMFAAVGRPPVGPQDLAAVPRGIRPVVAACLTPDAAGRPAARAVLARLLRRPASSDLLAEGARQARAAARAPETTPAPRHPEPAPRRSRPGVICGPRPVPCACSRSPSGPSTSRASSRARPAHGGQPGDAAPAPAVGQHSRRTDRQLVGPGPPDQPGAHGERADLAPGGRGHRHDRLPVAGLFGQAGHRLRGRPQAHPGPDHQQGAGRTAPTASSRWPPGHPARPARRAPQARPGPSASRSCARAAATRPAP